MNGRCKLSLSASAFLLLTACSTAAPQAPIGVVPFDAGRTQVPDAGSSIVDASLADSSSSDAAPDAQLLVPVDMTLIERGALWSYFDKSAEPASNWASLAFDASSWQRGLAPLGYNLPDTATTLSFGPDATNKYRTAYFLRAFDAPVDGDARALSLELVRDDGAAVYINGVEVTRSNLPPGALTYDTLASSTIAGADQSAATSFPLPPGVLRRGRNLIAVEIHQSTANSSDLRMDLALRGTFTGVDPETVDGVHFVGAGDVGDCASGGDESTADLLARIGGTVFLAGDTVYENGTAAEYQNCFMPTWGRHKSRIKPAAGNHEYNTPGALPYYDFFGTAAGPRSKGYYSYALGDWHVVVLNSNCTDVPCGAGSEQLAWLETDLQQNRAQCTLAYYHHPRFTSGSRGDAVNMDPLFRALYKAGADLVISGHDHFYERFRALDADGNADDAHGIVEFIVGTGGRNLTATGVGRAGSLVRDGGSFGVLHLVLRRSGYEFEFVPVAGRVFGDSGSGSCHAAPP